MAHAKKMFHAHEDMNIRTTLLHRHNYGNINNKNL